MQHIKLIFGHVSRRASYSFVALFTLVHGAGCGSSGSGDSCATALCVTAGETAVDPTGASQPTGPGDPTDPGDATGTPTGGEPPEPCAACSDEQVCIQGMCTDVPAMCPCPVETYCDLGLGKCVIGCTKDAECDEGRICDVDQRECRPGCREDGDCAAGEVCDATVCRIGCKSDADCPLETLCDLDARACYEGCNSIENCGPGKICKGAVCQVGCLDDSWCAAGEKCKADVCDATCDSDAECGPGKACINSMCAAGCKVDSECAIGQYCGNSTCTPGCGAPGGSASDGSNARCGVGEACTANGCTGGANCAEFVCSDVCTDTCNSSGSEQYVCYASALKTAKSRCMLKCVVDTDCPEGEYCTFHANPADSPYDYNAIDLCRRHCVSDSECVDMFFSDEPADCECRYEQCVGDFQGQYYRCLFRRPEND